MGELSAFLQDWGVFGDPRDLFNIYRLGIQYRDKLMGGIPKDPKMIEGWIRSKAGVTQQEEVRAMLIRTMLEEGMDVRPDMTMEELIAASEKVAKTKGATGFKVGEKGLYIEGRTLKACLKETTNILYASIKAGPTRKGSKAYFAERVFIEPDQIWLGKDEPDGVEMRVVHTTGAGGRQSSLAYADYVVRPYVEADVYVLKDAEREFLEYGRWRDIWLHAQMNGWGSVRSQGYDKFTVTRWDRID